MRLPGAIQALMSTKTEQDTSRPSWRYRRRLIHVAITVGVLMITAGALSVLWDSEGWDRQVSSELIIGGVALISIVLTAYVGGATWEDTRLWQPPASDEENPE